MLYVDGGDVLTSAGTAAGIDLCLHLVRRDHGAQIANQVARRMVVPPHRTGDQAQFVDAPLAAAPQHDDPVERGVMQWALERLDERIGVPELARHAHLSTRSLTRRFAEATGTSPARWLLEQRIAAGAELLERTDTPVEDVGALVGIPSPAAFRRHFARVMGVPPSVYRRTFSTTSRSAFSHSRRPTSRTASRSSSGPDDREVEAHHRQPPRQRLVALGARAHEHAVRVLLELAVGRREPPPRLLHRRVEQHLALDAPRHARQRPRDVLDGVEVLGRVGALGALVDVLDAIEAERAHLAAQVVVRGQVPAAGVHDEAVRVDLALGLLAGERAVRQPDPPLEPRRLGEAQHGVGRRRRARPPAAREPERLGHRPHALAQRERQHALDLRQRAVDRGLGGHEAVAAARRRARARPRSPRRR